MKKKLRKANHLKEDTDVQMLEHEGSQVKIVKSKRKRRGPKRDGCVGGGVSLAGNPTTSLAGDAAVGLAGDAIASLAGDSTTGSEGAPPGPVEVTVIRSTHSIPRGAVIDEPDVEETSISKPVLTPDMLRRTGKAVGKIVTRNIPARRILVKSMVR